jgi:predicted nucleic acid-binding protein
LIVYLDTSAVVPILIAEPSTDACRRIWNDADRRVSSRLTYVETSAALAMAERHARISAGEYEAAWSNFVDIWPDVDVVDLTAELSATAASFARSLSLRGYDAVHCASAAELNDPELVAAAGDTTLLAAWRSLGLAVIDTNQRRRD